MREHYEWKSDTMSDLDVIFDVKASNPCNACFCPSCIRRCRTLVSSSHNSTPGHNIDGCNLQMASQEIDFHFGTISYVAIDRVAFTYDTNSK